MTTCRIFHKRNSSLPCEDLVAEDCLPILKELGRLLKWWEKSVRQLLPKVCNAVKQLNLNLFRKPKEYESLLGEANTCFLLRPQVEIGEQTNAKFRRFRLSQSKNEAKSD